MHLEAVIEGVWRCTWRPRSWNSEIHLEAVIERVWRCSWRPRLSTFGDAFGGRDRVTQRCTWSRAQVELRDALRGQDQASLEMHLEAMINRVWRCMWRPTSSNSVMHLKAMVK